jgi:hypothetical protein
MHGPINVKSPNNISKWQMGFNSAFKGLIYLASLQRGKIFQPRAQERSDYFPRAGRID